MKIFTNSRELSERINQNEHSEMSDVVVKPPHEEDQSYVKTSLGSTEESAEGSHEILGVRWNHH